MNVARMDIIMKYTLKKNRNRVVLQCVHLDWFGDVGDELHRSI